MDVKVNFKGGGSFVKLPPQFSSESDNVYVAWKNQILGYNTKTGLLVGEFKGITDRIIGFSLHHCDSFECVTACSTSGEIVTWKTVTHFKMINKKIDRKKIKTFSIIRSDSDETKALISYRKETTIFFILFDLKTDSLRYYNLELTSGTPFLVDVSTKLFAVARKQKLSIVSLSNFTKVTTHLIDNGRQITCVKFHPDEEVILTGDSTGRVLVWQQIFSKPTKAVFHWHTLPVKCVAFSASGSYFYSGGEECVLVRWQLDNHMEKRFLPRLASFIEHITVSPGNTFVAVTTTDNAVKVVDSRFETISVIQHLVIGDQLESGIVLDGRTKALVMNGNVGQIQFYSPYDRTLLYNIDVVGQNKITNERSCKIESTQITKVAISKSGLWLATIEERQDTNYSSEIRLKFWLFDTIIQNFKLNTSIEYPHENHIHSIQFQPIANERDLKCVTVGADKKFKVWQLTDATTIYNKGNAWMCLCTGHYRDLPCKSSSFSIDGSLVAISFNQIVTTWLPDSCDLKCSLVHPNYKEPINQVQFGNHNQCHLIVSASNQRLSVWNLLTLTMMWTVTIDISLLISDALTTNMAVFTRDHKVFVFEPNSSEPVFLSDTLLSKHKVQAAAFVPSKFSNDARLKWYQRSPILFIDSNRELFSLGGDEDNEDNVAAIEDSESVFSLIQPTTKVNKTQALEPSQHLFTKDLGQKRLKKYFEAPIHTMIPIRVMCGSLLLSMVYQKNVA